MPKEHVSQGMEVRVLSSAQDDRLAQLVRAIRLHRIGRGFESLSGHKIKIVWYNIKIKLR